MIRLEVRNLPSAQIRDYLVEEFEGVAKGDQVSGEGWLVRLIDTKPATVGKMKVPVLFIEISGPNETAAAQFVKRKTMRGGG